MKSARARLRRWNTIESARDADDAPRICTRSSYQPRTAPTSSMLSIRRSLTSSSGRANRHRSRSPVDRGDTCADRLGSRDKVRVQVADQAVRQDPHRGARPRDSPPAVTDGEHLSRRSRPAIDPADPPTIVIDEADAIFGKGNKAREGSEDLRGILTRVIRMAGRTSAGTSRQSPSMSAPTFAMAMLAGIGDLPDTIEDRAVVVSMRRRAPRVRPSVRSAGVG